MGIGLRVSELLVLSPDGTPIHVANEDDNMLMVIKIAGSTVLAEVAAYRVAVGRLPWSVAIPWAIEE